MKSIKSLVRWAGTWNSVGTSFPVVSVLVPSSDLSPSITLVPRA